MNFYNIDQHISVIADIQTIFEHCGHVVADNSMSAHATLVGKPYTMEPLLDGDNWCRMNQRDGWSEFYDKYPNTFDAADAFIVTYPPIYAWLWEPYQKPILIDIPIRYDYGIHDEPWKIEKFHSTLKNCFVVANNMFDVKYCELFSGITPDYIPSLCDYTEMMYTGTKDKFLYYSKSEINGIDSIAVEKTKELQFGHKWQDIAQYKAIIHFPYQVSTMSIFEQYTACIPLFFPSKKYMRELYSKGLVLQQYVNNKIHGIASKSCMPLLVDVPDPNNYKDIDSVMWWVEYADYYNQELMPHIQYFDSIKDLKDKLAYTDFSIVSQQMKAYNTKRKVMIYKRWISILEKIRKLI